LVYMQPPRRHTVGARLVSWLLRIVAALCIALGMLHGLYTTAVGMNAVDLIPKTLWRWVDAMAPPSDGEAAENPTAIVLFLICLVAASGVVGLVGALLSRLRRLVAER
jgi:hypothetical protein